MKTDLPATAVSQVSFVNSIAPDVCLCPKSHVNQTKALILAAKVGLGKGSKERPMRRTCKILSRDDDS